MTVSVRSHLTAGIAMVGTAAVVLSPIAPTARDATLPPHRAAALAVELAASIDPITPWLTAITGAVDNIVDLGQSVLAEPLPIIQQIIANQVTYASLLPDYFPGSLNIWAGLVFGQVLINIANAVVAPVAVPKSCSDQENLGPCQNVNSTEVVIPDTPLGDLTQQAVFALLPQLLGAQYDSVKPVLEATVTPVSGILLGLLGPVVGPVLSVADSVGAIVGALGQGDVLGAINELINIPANLVNAVLNGGQFLDLAPLLSLAGVSLPASIKNFGFNMGGLLSPGGVMFDGLGFGFALGPASVVDPGLPVGPIGALLGLRNYIATAIDASPTSAQAKRRGSPAAASAPETAPSGAAPSGAAAVTADVPPGTDVAREVAVEPSGETTAPNREQRRGARGAAADPGTAHRPSSRASAVRRAG